MQGLYSPGMVMGDCAVGLVEEIGHSLGEYISHPRSSSVFCFPAAMKGAAWFQHAHQS